MANFVFNYIRDLVSPQSLKALNENFENLRLKLFGGISGDDIEHNTIDTQNIKDLAVDSAKIGLLAVKSANIDEAQIKSAHIDEAQITNAHISNLVADRIKADKIDVADIQATYLNSVYATIDNLTTNYATIASLATVKFSGAQIDGGIINGSLVQIQGANGRLVLNNNRFQVFDYPNGDLGQPLFERVVLGDVNNDGTKYGLRIRAADGTTQLLDENGLTNQGFTDGYNKLATGALNPAKLDIASVITLINANGSTTISGSKIFVDNQTLDVKINKINTDKNNIVKVRYIRDWVNGNTVNTGNHWIEIKAMQGTTNLASGKTVTSSDGGASNLNRVTDGIITSGVSDYAQALQNINQWVKVDLGAVYDNIDYIQVWHYWADGRTYHNTKTEVSTDNVNWFTLFDSSVNGEYAETSSGRIFNVNMYGITNRIALAEANITAQAGQISAKVTQAQVDTSINDLNTMTKLNGIELFDQGYLNNIAEVPFTTNGGAYSIAPCTDIGLTDNLNVIKCTDSTWLKSEFIPYNPLFPLYMKVSVYNKTTTNGLFYMGVEYYDKDKVTLGSNDLCQYGISGIPTTTLLANTLVALEGYVQPDSTNTRNIAAYIKLRILTRWQSLTGVTYLKGISFKQLGGLSDTNARLNSAELKITPTAIVQAINTTSGVGKVTTSVGTFNDSGFSVTHSSVGTSTLMNAAGFKISKISTGEVIGDFTASEAGFTSLRADSVYANNIIAEQKVAINYYVDGTSGSDTNAGTSGSKFKTVAKALSMYNNIFTGQICTIYIYGTVFENILVENFIGYGVLELNFNASATFDGTVVVRGCNVGILVTGGRTGYNTNDGCIAKNSANLNNIFQGQSSNYVRFSGFRMVGKANQNACAFWSTRGWVFYMDFYNFGGNAGCIVAKDQSIIQVYDSIGGANNCYCSSNDASIIAGGTVGGGMAIPYGSGINAYTTHGGTVTLNNPSAYDSLYKPTAPVTQTYTTQYGTTQTQSWRDSGYGWRSDNNYIYQGNYGYGTHTGFMCFDSATIRSNLSGATINSVRLYLTRNGSGGNSAATNIHLFGHSYDSTGGGTSISSDWGYVGSYAWGEAKWISLPVSVGQQLQSGVIHGLALYDGTSNYAIFAGSATLEITYTK